MSQRRFARLELGVASHKVGLAVELHQHRGAGGACHAHEPLRGNTCRLQRRGAREHRTTARCETARAAPSLRLQGVRANGAPLEQPLLKTPVAGLSVGSEVQRARGAPMSQEVATSADLTSCMGAPDLSRSCGMSCDVTVAQRPTTRWKGRTSLMRARLLDSRVAAASAGVRSLAWRVAAPTSTARIALLRLSSGQACARGGGAAGGRVQGRTRHDISSVRTRAPWAHAAPSAHSCGQGRVPRIRRAAASGLAGPTLTRALPPLPVRVRRAILVAAVADSPVKSTAVVGFAMLRGAAPAGCRAAPLARAASNSRSVALAVARDRAPCWLQRRATHAPRRGASLQRRASLLRHEAASPFARPASRVRASLGSQVRLLGAARRSGSTHRHALVAQP